ncbi:4-hydroxy-tetrahydrodipicolinate synthase [Pelagibacterium lacus]|uniref:4-hydroxy-tetrahydrodipicolinate synthase n=1 Tax=Pelagibacterium lacus TaxID=2282655 RepID=A0A369W3V0_9HYPH|nr:4-hydroxy-tetrahydrodipicolinate synthase [Pelagibacterium lacus]RDE09003.1 4-hydroxy-tetrahydrodipicolinate synthase [Pelagibacterium lacus]
MLSGSITALLTPFRNGAVDEDALARFVKWQIDEGTNGLVPVGTTGESPTVSHEEHRRVIELTIAVAEKRVPVVAGAGSNSTREAIHLAQFAEEAGADAILTIVPYYNKPSQEGQFQHFAAIARATSLPVIVYSVPGRTVVDIQVDTLKRLRDECPNVIGIKDATADMAKATQTRSMMGSDFVMLSGEDITALGFNAHGGKGCISVTANIAPRLCSEFQAACRAGDYATALSIQDRLAPLHRALFLEPNPQGAKYAAARLGLFGEDIRLPLVPASDATRGAIDAALVHAGLIN